VTLLEETIASIPDVDAAIGRRTQRLFDGKTKPRRSLGRLEDVACAYAAMRGDPLPPPPDKAILVMAADHGVAAEGVSAYPQEVTRQMLHNFAAGGAAINVLARRAGVAGGDEDLLQAGRLGQAPGQRVLAAAGTDDEKFHNSEPFTTEAQRHRGCEERFSLCLCVSVVNGFNQ